jgi:hypothetical protein
MRWWISFDGYDILSLEATHMGYSTKCPENKHRGFSNDWNVPTDATQDTPILY